MRQTESCPFPFNSAFANLTSHPPFRWQSCLYEEWLARGRIPSALDIPTGLGKTSVMVLWYLALKAGSAVPRRLVYVVDRRTVVDQATTVAEEIKEKAQDSKLRVSTLRGQHIDNRDWLADPAAPAIVVGTVDMIGSRLLFSGYGVSRKMRPYHAGLLGADTLLVLDEAHLVPPFEKLLEAIADGAGTFDQKARGERAILPPFRLLSLSATGRNDGAAKRRVFRLLPEYRHDEAVRERLEACKRLTIQVLDDAPQLVPNLVERAWSMGHEPPARVLVYCDRREDAVKVKGEIDKRLRKENREPVSELLIGGRRVFEREELSDWLEEHGFFGSTKGAPEQSTFLIATSAGEVGVDLDADHMVCDLVQWERMVQRLGRVNRRGRGAAQVEVIAAPHAGAKIDAWKERLARLRKPLDGLRPVGVKDVEPGGQLHSSFATSGATPVLQAKEKQLQTTDDDQRRDASPGAILDLTERAAQDQDLHDAIAAATTPMPLRPALTRPLVDAWSLTSLAEHTGRPDDIQPWLRGWGEDQQPQTTVVWRRYLPVRKGKEAPKPTAKEIEAFFEAAPPHASEKLETETYRIVKWLRGRAAKAVGNKSEASLAQDDVVAYVLSPAQDWRDTIRGSDLAKSAENDLQQKLANATLVIDARFGGLNDGMLDNTVDSAPRVIDDDQGWPPPQDDRPVIRFRVRCIDGEESLETHGDWRERHRFMVAESGEGEVQRFLLVEKWRHDAETEDDRSVGHLQELTEHHAWTEARARALADEIELPAAHADMLATAARLHDEGKRHRRWQQAAKVPPDGKCYAKTDKRMNTHLLDGYRHEFGSLPYASRDEGFRALPVQLQELALHLIAAHHGWARPVISISGGNEPPSVLERRARDVALRFARLQKQWGPWGLAWWEALLRAADQQASRDNDERVPNVAEVS